MCVVCLAMAEVKHFHGCCCFCHNFLVRFFETHATRTGAKKKPNKMSNKTQRNKKQKIEKHLRVPSFVLGKSSKIQNSYEIYLINWENTDLQRNKLNIYIVKFFF